MNRDKTSALRQLPAPTVHRMHIEALLDEALAASFPSSDPIAMQAPLQRRAGLNPGAEKSVKLNS